MASLSTSITRVRDRLASVRAVNTDPHCALALVDAISELDDVLCTLSHVNDYRLTADAALSLLPCGEWEIGGES